MLPTAVLLFNNKQFESAKLHMHQFRALYNDMDEEARRVDPEIGEQAAQLSQQLGM